ncbi:MAG: 2-dehydropantoate 2-reductase [Chloroflexi bacterium]|nr:2-dehydropantoate 2-reductase [Chloroflexota bacterium]
MKILIMGAGAVGGYFGGALSRAGEDVTFIARGRQLEAMQKYDLRVESATMGDFTVRPRVVERPDGSWKADLVLLCVKSYQNEEAIEAMRPAVGDDTVVLTLQNGIGGGDQLAAALGRERVLLGAAYIEAMRKAPGVVHQAGGPPRIVFGEEACPERSRRDGSESQRGLVIRDTLRRAGIDAQLSPDIMKALWSKLIFICALSGMTCITRASFAEVIDTPQTRELTWQVMREAFSVGRASGVGLDGDIVEKTMAEFQRDKQDLISSMYLDLQAGNPLEIGVINGAVSRIGKEVGVATPVNDFITACLAIADNRARGLPPL